MRFRFFLLLQLAFTFCIWIFPVSAQSSPPLPGQQCADDLMTWQPGTPLPPSCQPVKTATTPSKKYDIADLRAWFNIVVNSIFAALGAFTVFTVVQSGLQVVMNAGNDAKIKEGIKGLRSAGTGLIAVGLSYGAVTGLIHAIYKFIG